MEDAKTLPDEEMFEELFKDRFTARDEKYVEIQLRKLSLPPVIHPWKVPGRIFHKRWEHSRGTHEQGRSRYDRDRDRSHSYRDRSEDGDRNRRERQNSSSRNWDERNRNRGSPNKERQNERNSYR